MVVHLTSTYILLREICGTRLCIVMHSHALSNERPLAINNKNNNLQLSSRSHKTPIVLFGESQYLFYQKLTSLQQDFVL